MEGKREGFIFHLSADDSGDALREVLPGDRHFTGNKIGLFPIKEGTGNCRCVLLLGSTQSLFVIRRFSDNACKYEIRHILSVQVLGEHFISYLHDALRPLRHMCSVICGSVRELHGWSPFWIWHLTTEVSGGCKPSAGVIC